MSVNEALLFVIVSNGSKSNIHQKYYSEPKTLLVSDPTNSTREGDVVSLEGGRRISRHVRHVVAGVIAPMGPPMSARTPIPSAVERIAAVEAKRAAKDIRQAARGRWPAIVRVREREARASGEIQEVQQQRVITLEEYVKTVRRQKSEISIPEFIRVAGYEVLEGELPLHAQVSALNDAKSKQRAIYASLDKELLDGTNPRSNIQHSPEEKKSLSEERMQANERIHQLRRNVEHLASYMEELTPRRRNEFANNPIEWFDLVRALHMSHWEQNIAALDLWGQHAVADAAELDLQDALSRAGIAIPEIVAPSTSGLVEEAIAQATPVADSAKPVADPIIDEAAIRASEIEEQSLAREDAGVAEESNALNIDPKAADALSQSADAQLEAEISDIIENARLDQEARASQSELQSQAIEDAAVEAQRLEAAELSAGEKDLPPKEVPGKASPEDRHREALSKAENEWEKGLEHEAEIEAEKKEAKAEGFKVEEEKTPKSGGFWGLFGGRK